LGKTANVNAIGSGGLTISARTVKYTGTSTDEIANTASVTVSGGSLNINGKTEQRWYIHLGGGGTFLGTGGGTLTATSVSVTGSGNLISSGTVAGNANQAAGSALTINGTLNGTDNLAAGVTRYVRYHLKLSAPRPGYRCH